MAVPRHRAARRAGPSGQPGVTNDALYTDSTVALDPDTGKLVWYFQHQNNDQWDFDWAFERQIIKLPLFGQNRTVVVTGGNRRSSIHSMPQTAYMRRLSTLAFRMS